MHRCRRSCSLESLRNGPSDLTAGSSATCSAPVVDPTADRFLGAGRSMDGRRGGLVAKNSNSGALVRAPSAEYSSGAIRSGGRSPHGKSKQVKPPPNPQVRRYSTVTGTKKIPDPNSRIAAAVVRKRTSVFVGRLAADTAVEDLLDFLKGTFGRSDFEIEKLVVRSGSYSSFRVETDVELLDRIFSADNWPEGIVIKKFRFFRSKNLNNQEFIPAL